MIELRYYHEMEWVHFRAGMRQAVPKAPLGVLQYRYLIPCVDASGALCPGSQWSEWASIPHVEGFEPTTHHEPEVDE